MKRAFIFLFFLIAFSGAGYAQSVTPEFELRLHYSDPGGGGMPNPVGFGYDPAAKIVTENSTEVDTEFGEVIGPLTTPGGLGSFDEMFALDPVDGSYIDILPKPSSNAFILQYTFYLSPFQVPATLSWDRTKIPSAIKGIWITPASESFFKMGDMVTQDSVIITSNVTDTNYYSNWGPVTFTLYYNTIPAFLGVASSAVPNGLISGLSTYPNPMLENGTLSFSLSEQASVVVTGYDALGREVLHMTKNGPAGENQLDLSAASSAMLASARGAILLRVDASSGTRFDTKTVMLVKE